MKNSGKIMSKCRVGFTHFFSVVLLIIGILSTNGAMAAVGGFDEDAGKGVSVSIYKNGSSSPTAIYKNKVNGWGQDYDFGFISTLYIGDASAFYYQSSDGSGCPGYYNICGCKLYWQVRDLSNNSIKKSNNYTLTDQGQSWANCYNHSQFLNGSMGVDIHSQLNPGKYHLEWWFKIWGGAGSSNCSTDQYYKWGENNFYVNFTMPGFKADNLPFGEVVKNKTSTQKYSFSSYGWASCDAEITGGNDLFYFDGDLHPKTKTISISNDKGEVYITFAPTSSDGVQKTATLTLSGETENGIQKSVSVTLSGTGVAANPITVLVGDTVSVFDGPKATLNGYLKYSSCDPSLNKYGFYYIKKTDHNCTDVEGNDKQIIELSGTGLNSGDSWSASITDGLETNTSYYYKPYVVSANQKSTTTSASCGEFTTRGGCQYSQADTIYYTIDGSLPQDDPCGLSFSTIDAAFTNLFSHNVNESDNYWWDDSHKMLKKNIVFLVKPNDAGYGTENGRISFENINRYSESDPQTPTKSFVIRSFDGASKPLIYGMNLARSRWVTVKNLTIKRDSPSTSDGKGHACILIGFDSEDNGLEVGKMSDSKIEFVNCDIKGENFCCIHANGVNGLYMENCNLIAEAGSITLDTYNWGAYMKFMNSKNIELVRNNFKGSHSQNIFAQNVTNVLMMNNVFWNDNDAVKPSGKEDKCNDLAFIRLIYFNANSGFTQLAKIGMYYNTFYLANAANSSNTNFLTLGGKAKNDSGTQIQQKDKTKYDFNSIDFMYNNCYSYDDDVQGRTSDAFCSQEVVESTHLTRNNFWSEYDVDQSHTTSSFAFGSDTEYVNVKDQVCSTAPNTPEGLVIKGTGLDLGSQITADVSGLGGELINADRLKYNIRPASPDKWTLGAYQSASGGEAVHKIIWRGSEDAGTGSNWDNRNNWVKEDGSLLTCVDQLAEDLEIVIPAKDSKYGVVKYPTIPVWSKPTTAEEVRAGLNSETVKTVTNFANHINVEYGGAVLGIENLKVGNTYHYKQATSNLTVDPKDWVLVGSVMRKFNAGAYTTDADSTTRNIKSGDYYIEKQEPHVYMQQFTVEGDNITWGTPFTSLEQSVAPTQSFAIFVADQYGPRKQKASKYYAKDPEHINDGDLPRTFTQNGRFTYEQSAPSIKLASGFNVLNNAYPASLNATTLKDALPSGSTVYLYDYSNGDWTEYSLASEAARMIKPQSGFVINSKEAATVSLSGKYSQTDDTKYKSVNDESGIVLYGYNTSNNRGSKVGIWYHYMNAEKAFNGSVLDNAEIYAIEGTKKYTTLTKDDMSVIIPLGVRNKTSKYFTIRFSITHAEGIESAILEDRSVTPVAKYDILAGQDPYFRVDPGDTEGRFYLNLNYADEEDKPLPTDVEENGGAVSSIDIYSQGGLVTISASDNLTLKRIILIDLTGRTQEYAPKGSNFSQHRFSVPEGTYIVKVVADGMTAEQKVIISK